MTRCLKTNSSAIESAMRLLARREHSSKELTRKLTQRGFLPVDIESALCELIKSNALSHERFAHSYVYTRVDKGFGPVRIASGLRERGIDEHLTHLALAEYHDEWLQRAKAVDKKRFGSSAPQNTLERYKRQQFLLYRGFSHDDIEKVWDDE